MSGIRAARPPFLVLLLVLVAGLLFLPQATLASGSGGGHESVSAEAGDHGAGEGHGGGVSEAKFWDFIWRTLNFVVLFVILFIVLRKPMSQFFGNRRANIAQTLSDFEDRKAKAESRFKELEDKLASLEGERDRIISAYVKEGEEEKEKIIAHAEEMAERIKNQAEVTIGLEIGSAKAELMREIADLSATMAEDLIKKNINTQDQERLVEEYLEKVVHN